MRKPNGNVKADEMNACKPNFDVLESFEILRYKTLFFLYSLNVCQCECENQEMGERGIEEGREKD